MDEVERFYSKIKINKQTGCWEWLGGTFTNGYGVFKAKRKTWRAHRYSYTISKGKIPENKILHHKCENKLCVNPKHLEPITILEHPKISTNHNTNKTHCIRGHLLSGKNLYITPSSGKRVCSKCSSESKKKFLQNNPGKSTEYNYRWRAKNREKWDQYMREYYKKHKLTN